MGETKLRSLQPYAQSILRIVAGFVFMQFGLGKLMGFGSPTGSAVHVGTLLWFAGWIETVGGALILLGLLTVPVAFILCGEMATAYFMIHAPNGPLFPAENGGAPAALFCFIYLFLFTAGPGPLSLDNLILRMRGKA